MNDPSGPLAGSLEEIWFDCDSTLSRIEGIDELGTLRDEATRNRVVEATNRAMGGEVPLEQVFGERLRILAPTRDELERVAQLYIDRVVEDAKPVCEALHSLGKSVGIVSGGLLPAVCALGDWLGIDRTRIHAVDLSFGDDGSYLGFDEESLLARSGGKPKLLESLGVGHRRAAFVGDGITDLETAPLVTRFIGFGGVARREAVVAGAECFAEGPGLASTLPFLLTDDERSMLSESPDFRSLFPTS